MPDHVYAVCERCGHYWPLPAHALNDWPERCENCRAPDPDCAEELSLAEAMSESARA